MRFVTQAYNPDMKRLLLVLIAASLLLAPSASAETASLGLLTTPFSPLYKDAYRPINWQVQTNIASDAATILPMKKAVLKLGSDVVFRPNSKVTPVCPDSKIGPIAGVGIPPAALIARCPNSIIGNGTAAFQLGQNNSPIAARQGLMLIFNGGFVNNLPRIKISAYSFETNAGVYVEGILKQNGEIVFSVPVLTADSSVTSLNLNIPGKDENVYVSSIAKTVFLPKGKDQNYARARCQKGMISMSGDFYLGRRTNDGADSGPTTILSSSSENSCSGRVGSVKISKVAVKGKARVSKTAKYKVTISNSGTASAKSVKLKVKGAGVSFVQVVSEVPAEGSVTVSVPLKFKKKGVVLAKFSFASKSATKKVTVR